MEKKRIYTKAEMNIELTNNPIYYPHYLKNRNLTMRDIFYNIQTDFDDKLQTTDEPLTNMENQLYHHLNQLIESSTKVENLPD